MRVFFLGKDASVIVNNDITVTVIDFDGEQVTLGIDAPEWMGVGEIKRDGLKGEGHRFRPLQPR